MQVFKQKDENVVVNVISKIDKKFEILLTAKIPLLAKSVKITSQVSALFSDWCVWVIILVSAAVPSTI